MAVYSLKVLQILKVSAVDRCPLQYCSIEMHSILFHCVLQVYLCGDSEEAKQKVSVMATRLGVTVIDRGSLSVAGELEDFPLRLFPEWKMPLILSAVIFAFFYIYLIIRDVIYAKVEKGQDNSYRIFLALGNKVHFCHL